MSSSNGSSSTPAHRLHGKTAIVTGSTKGFGEGIALRFGAEGANVVVTGRSASGADVAAKIQDAGGSAIFTQADISAEESVRGIVAAAVETFGSVDILVNNAMAQDLLGTNERRVEDMETEGLDKILRVGLYGTFWACKYAIPEMRNAGGGSIINISSIASVAGVPAMPAYTACKGAINALARQMAVDYAQDRIRVNTMISGFIMSGDLAAAIEVHPVAAPLMRDAQLTRWGRHSDIAGLATYLASDESEFITGAEMRIDGGWTATARVPNLQEMVFSQMAQSQQP